MPLTSWSGGQIDGRSGEVKRAFYCLSVARLDQGRVGSSS